MLGKHVKIMERRAVRMETKGDKMENRILVRELGSVNALPFLLKNHCSFQVFTACRLFVFTPKVPTKIDFNIHYLDLQSIESKKLTQVIGNLYCCHPILIINLFGCAAYLVNHRQGVYLPYPRGVEPNF